MSLGDHHCMLDESIPRWTVSRRVRNCRSCKMDVAKGDPAIQWWGGFQVKTIVVCKHCVHQMNDAMSRPPVPTT